MEKHGVVDSENTPAEKPQCRGAACGCKTQVKVASDALGQHPATRAADAVAKAVKKE